MPGGHLGKWRAGTERPERLAGLIAGGIWVDKAQAPALGARKPKAVKYSLWR
jgi:hypothetical protein